MTFIRGCGSKPFGHWLECRTASCGSRDGADRARPADGSFSRLRPLVDRERSGRRLDRGSRGRPVAAVTPVDGICAQGRRTGQVFRSFGEVARRPSVDDRWSRPVDRIDRPGGRSRGIADAVRQGRWRWFRCRGDGSSIDGPWRGDPASRRQAGRGFARPRQIVRRAERIRPGRGRAVGRPLAGARTGRSCPGAGRRAAAAAVCSHRGDRFAPRPPRAGDDPGVDCHRRGAQGIVGVAPTPRP